LNLQINAGAVGTNELADNAVTTEKIADNAVNMSKISQVSCASGYALVSIGGGSYNCIPINATQGVINGSGSAGQVAFFTASNTITGSNNLYWDNANSRLGINVIGTPAYTLHVNGTARIMNILDMNNANIQNINHLIIADPGAVEGLGWYGTAAGWVIDVSPLDRSNADGNLNLYGTSNNIIAWRPTYIYTSATPQLVINSTGTTAQFILQTSNIVRGNITADNSGNVYITPGNYLVVSSGNVGIGTTSPGEKLEVAGNVKITGSRIKNSAGYGIVQTDATDWLRINPDSQYPAIALYKPVAIGTGGLAIGEWSQQPSGVLKVTQSAYLATAGGNVGIGTTNPLNKLEVVGTTNITSAGTMFYVDANGNIWVKL
jgi:hypothetical protein